MLQPSVGNTVCGWALTRWQLSLFSLFVLLVRESADLTLTMTRRTGGRTEVWETIFLAGKLFVVYILRVSWYLLFVRIKLLFLGIWSLLWIVVLWLGVLDYISKNFEIKMPTSFFITEGTIIRPTAIYSLHFQQSAKSTLTTRTLNY